MVRHQILTRSYQQILQFGPTILSGLQSSVSKTTSRNSVPTILKSPAITPLESPSPITLQLLTFSTNPKTLLLSASKNSYLPTNTAQ